MRARSVRRCGGSWVMRPSICRARVRRGWWTHSDRGGHKSARGAASRLFWRAAACAAGVLGRPWGRVGGVAARPWRALATAPNTALPSSATRGNVPMGGGTSPHTSTRGSGASADPAVVTPKRSTSRADKAVGKRPRNGRMSAGGDRAPTRRRGGAWRRAERPRTACRRGHHPLQQQRHRPKNLPRPRQGSRWPGAPAPFFPSASPPCWIGANGTHTRGARHRGQRAGREGTPSSTTSRTARSITRWGA